MRINAIGVTTFGNKSQFVKKAAIGMTGLAAGVAADTFVKGLSKPNSQVENVIKANDGMGEENICFDYSSCDD